MILEGILNSWLVLSIWVLCSSFYSYRKVSFLRLVDIVFGKFVLDILFRVIGKSFIGNVFEINESFILSVVGML